MQKNRTKLTVPWRTLALLMLVALSVQGCLGVGDSSKTGNFKSVSGSNLQVNGDQSHRVFNGHFFFTKGHNLFMIDGLGNSKQLSHGAEVHDPAVSPDGKYVAFVVRYKNYSDLMMMSTTGGWNTRKTLLSGNGRFKDAGHDSFHWFTQPAWVSDSNHLLFLSDLQKDYYWSDSSRLGSKFPDAQFLDLQVFEISVTNVPSIDDEENNGAVAYATFGDGGDQDPQFRPGTKNEFVFTHFQYDPDNQTTQQVQIEMGNTDAIRNSDAATYNPFNQPAMALTDTSKQNMKPAFSPDGNAIAFIQRDADGLNSHLNIMPAPQKGLTDNGFSDKGTQGKALAPFIKSSVSLFTQQFISQPVWSPDGSQVAYLSYANETFDLWFVNVKLDPKSSKYSLAGDPVQLTNGGVDGDSRPAWAK